MDDNSKLCAQLLLVFYHIENTNFLLAFFLITKDEQVQVIFRHLIHITNEKIFKVKYIRYDKSGEKKDLQNQFWTITLNWYVILRSQNQIHHNKTVKLKESLLTCMVG
jgi:hypothetical protein